MTRRAAAGPRIAPPEPAATVAAPDCVLENQHYRALVTATGTGYSTLDATTLTAWSRDRLEDRDGYFFYLRDLETGTPRVAAAFWSAGRKPAALAPERYDSGARHGGFVIARRDLGIETRLEIRVPPDASLELRRLELFNTSERVRTIEVTSYAEVVLHTWEAHASHPAFSRLFVQTEALPELGALLARRRPRAPDERHPWMAHALLEPGAFACETDRVRFIGRGRSLAAPLALAPGADLSGATGNVLDPIVSLRRVVAIEPGATARLTFLLGAAPDREATIALLQHWRDPFVQEQAFGHEAEETPRRAGSQRGARAPSPEAAHENGHAALAAAPRGYDVANNAASTATGLAPAGDLPSDPTANRGDDPMVSLGDDLHRDPVARLGDGGDGNGFGGFEPDGAVYAIHLAERADGTLALPPRPWVNVIANESFGCLVSETGAGATWSQNSRVHRLTPWSNDALLDPHGEAFYVRDESSGEVWSALAGPRAAAGGCDVRHGFGWSEWRSSGHGLDQRATVFVARHDPVKLVSLALHNPGDRTRELSLYAYQQLVLGMMASETAPFIVTEIDGAAQAVFARRPNDEVFGGRVAFAAAVTDSPIEAQFTCDRAEFLGEGRGVEDPASPLSGDPLGERAGAGFDPCFAERLRVAIAPRASVHVTFLLGEGADQDDARALIARYRASGEAARALEEIQAYWRDLTSAVRIETPVPAIDAMVNGWLAYQTVSCRMWGRTAAYQSGGAFGFRDQLQDAIAMTWHAPALAREQILLHAAHQFVEGDVLHWWHPPSGRGLRTRFADDRLWLPYLTAAYVAATGDSGVLDEPLPFVEARALDEGEDEAFLETHASSEVADLYEHCCRAIDRSLSTGAHGLPLFGSGDWNDGMNRVGREGRGESVWMAFFLDAVLGDFDALAARRGDEARRARHGAHRERLRTAVDAHAWDGDWYLRGFYDDGTPLGSRSSDECRIDALVQAWSVISGAKPAERAARAMDAVERHLISEDEGLIRLLTPPFENTPRDPGYIQGYVPGVRENGGQYTHAAMWVVQALATLGRRDRAARLLEMLSPVTRTATAESVATYEVEPYVVAADVYGAPPHVGRGGWTWYTGSAGWMLRVALESVLGLTLQNGDCLVVRPCIPDGWPGFNASLRIGDARTRYSVRVTNPRRCAVAVVEASVDGAPVAIEDGAARVPLRRDGGEHRIEVVLG